MTYCEHCGTDAERDLRKLRDEQHALALLVRDSIEQARSEGLSWQKIGDALGLTYATAYRQFMSGGPINTVRVTHKPEEK